MKNSNSFDEHIFESIINVSQDAIIIIDEKGMVVFWNPSAEFMFGYSANEVIGQDLHDLLMPDTYRAQFDIAFMHYQETGEGNAIGKTVELKSLTKSGELIDISLSLSSLIHNGAQYSVGMVRNISLEKKSSRQFKALFESMLEGVALHELVYDEQGHIVNYRILDVNSQYEQILRIEKSNAIGMLGTEVYQTESAPYLDEFSKVALTDKPKQFETFFPPLKKHFLISVFSPAPKQFATIFEDITDRKETERLLLKSEERFEMAMYASQDGLFDWDLKTNSIYFSPGWKKMLGYEYDELSNDFSIWEEFTHPDDVASSWEMMNAHLEGKRDRFEKEFRMKHKKGYWVDILSRATAFRDDSGKPVRVVGTHVDISKRKNIEEDLHMLMQAIEQSPTCVVITNQEGQVEYVNPYFTQLTGYTLDEVLGHKTNVLKSGEQSDGFYHEMWETIKSGKNWYGEFHNKKKNGELYWENAIISPVKNEVGTITHYVAVKENITEKKKLWNELLQAKEVAEVASRAKSEFLANMSHEIRTPLNGVIGFTELLRETDLNAAQQQYLENTHISANSLLGVINDILDFSKIEAGRLNLEMIMTDMVSLLEEAMDIIKYQAYEKGLELLLDIDPEMVRFAEVDPVRLKQVLVNLLGNAVKFTEKGDVTLKVTYQKQSDHNGIFCFSVSDTGIGIKEEDHSLLFKAFRQADTSTTRKFGGTGLGLTISNHLVKEMGGEIVFQSLVGKGTTFSFGLETEVQESVKASNETPYNIQRVMVVDASRSVLNILEKQFAHWGIEFNGCEDRYIAKGQLADSDAFDVIIVDYHMPNEKNGLEIIHFFREEKVVSEGQLFILMLGTSDNISDIMDSVVDFTNIRGIQKPVKPLTLLSCIAEGNCQDDFVGNAGYLKTSVSQQPSHLIPRIIVAEDVRLNMILITELIHQCFPNAEIVEASTGQAVIDYLSKHSVDLILMDVQMPVMDGIEATIHIRSMDADKKDVPIVALTAGAFHSDREKCMAAGMDEFIPKPIQRKNLFDILLYYLGSSKDILSMNIPKESKEMSGLHFDYEKFKEQMGDDEEICLQVIQMVPETFKENLDDLASAVAEGDRDKIRKVTHRVKGASLNMCFTQLVVLMLRLEKQLKEGEEIIDYKSWLNEVTNEWQFVLDDLEKYR